MTKKRILCVAQDPGPSGALERLAQGLTQAGFEVLVRSAYGKSFPITQEQLAEEVRASDLVSIGMSAKPEQMKDELFAAVVAGDAGIPYVFYGDVAGCSGRTEQWDNPLASSRATAYFAPSPAGLAEDGTAPGLPGAKVFVTGNPLREEAFFPRFTRKQARERLGVEQYAKVVLIAGGASVYSNMGVLRQTLQALELVQARTADKFPIRVFWSLHPKDLAPDAISSTVIDKNTNQPKLLNIYKEVEELSSVSFKVLPASNDFKTLDAMVGVDVVMSGLTGSAAIEAASLRIPAIQLGGPIERLKLEKDTRSRVTEAEAAGVEAQLFRRNILKSDKEFTSSEFSKFSNSRENELASLLWSMFGLRDTGPLFGHTDCQPQISLSPDHIAGAQGKAYPKPDKVGAATANMVKAVCEILQVQPTPVA